MASLKKEGAGQLGVAHFNHHLRGGESAGDEAFVVELCRQFEIPHEVGHAKVGRCLEGDNAASPGGSSEAATRHARYNFFRHAAERLGARYLVTAHTADDQAETILHRVIRGTSVAGLSGMARARSLGPAVTLIRPLLTFRRWELRAYLADLEQPFRHDSSNADVRFTRNRIRHRLLPELAEQFNPGVVEALVRLGSLAGDAQEVVDRVVDTLACRCVNVDSAGRIEIHTALLADQPRHVIRQLLLTTWRDRAWPLGAMGFVQWDRLAGMVLGARSEHSDCANAPTRHTLPGNIDAEVRDGILRLARSAAGGTGS